MLVILCFISTIIVTIIGFNEYLKRKRHGRKHMSRCSFLPKWLVNNWVKVWTTILGFFLESFNLWRSFLMIVFYYQTKIQISFWCRQRLNPRSFIQPLEILLIELIRTYIILGLFPIRLWNCNILHTFSNII